MLTRAGARAPVRMPALTRIAPRWRAGGGPFNARSARRPATGRAAADAEGDDRPYDRLARNADLEREAAAARQDEPAGESGDGADRAVIAERRLLGGAGREAHGRLGVEPVVTRLGRVVEWGQPRARGAMVAPPSMRVAQSRSGGAGAHAAAEAGGALSLVYPRGLILTEFRGTDAARFVGKLAGPGTTVEVTEVKARRGFGWRAARTASSTSTRAGNTLLWQRGPLTLRLEGVGTKAAALGIARVELRGVPMEPRAAPMLDNDGYVVVPANKRGL